MTHPTPPNLWPIRKKHINVILDEHVVSNRGGGV